MTPAGGAGRHRRPRRVGLSTIGYLFTVGWLAGYLSAVVLQVVLR